MIPSLPFENGSDCINILLIYLGKIETYNKTLDPLNSFVLLLNASNCLNNIFFTYFHLLLNYKCKNQKAFFLHTLKYFKTADFLAQVKLIAK